MTPLAVVSSGPAPSCDRHPLGPAGRARRVEHVGAGDAIRQRRRFLGGDAVLVGVVASDRAVEHQPRRHPRRGGDDRGGLLGEVARRDEHRRRRSRRRCRRARRSSAATTPPCRPCRRSGIPTAPPRSGGGSRGTGRRGRPGSTPSERSSRDSRLAAASSSANVVTAPVGAQITAGCVGTGLEVGAGVHRSGKVAARIGNRRHAGDTVLGDEFCDDRLPTAGDTVDAARRRSTSRSTACSPTTRRRRPTSSTFLGAQFDRGLAWVHFPVGEGGLGLSPKHQRTINERLAGRRRPDAMWRNPIGYGMVAPTLITWGTRRAEAPLPAPAVHGRGDLVPAVLRTWRRLRLRRPRRPRCARRRRVGRQRPEGVDVARPRLALGPARRAHRPGGGQARRADRLRRRHAGAGCRRAAAAPDHRRRRVQRGVLHRHAHSRRRRCSAIRATAGACR